MYEIWLVMNILWEIALGIWPLLALAAASWLGLMVLAWRQPAARWRGMLPRAASIAVAVALAGFLVIPTAVRSSLQELAYWVDWANLAGMALVIGVAALAFAWPAGVAWRRHIIEE